MLLNWVEAKAELATLGGQAVTQADIDKTINKLRNRPIAPEAVAMGVTKTAALRLEAIPDDPVRDADVPALIWEIRRGDVWEFAFEYSRIADLERWHKLNMDTDKRWDILCGGWVNFPTELKTELTAANAGKFSVADLTGKFTVQWG